MHLEILKEITSNGTPYWWVTATYKGFQNTRWSTSRHAASWEAVKDTYNEAKRNAWGHDYHKHYSREVN
jgi:hypothetical protein